MNPIAQACLVVTALGSRRLAKLDDKLSTRKFARRNPSKWAKLWLERDRLREMRGEP
jgi:hypothetical protein